MDARAPTLEVVAGATPLAGIEGDMMGVVVATEGEGQAVDRDPIELRAYRFAFSTLPISELCIGANLRRPWGADEAAVRSAPSTGGGGRVPSAYTAGRGGHPRKSSYRRADQDGSGVVPHARNRPRDGRRRRARGRDLDDLAPLDGLVTMDPAGLDVTMTPGSELDRGRPRHRPRGRAGAGRSG